MQALRKCHLWLLLVALSIYCLSCKQIGDETAGKVSESQQLNWQQAIEIVKKALAEQKPFGFASIDEERYEIETDRIEDGRWIVTFTEIPGSPGGYFFAILTSDGSEVQFWPGK